MSKVASLSEEEISKIALDLYKGQIFCDKHIDSKEKPVMLPMIFLPVGLGCFGSYSKEELKEIGMLFQYYTEAGNQTINGYPTFMSVRVINVEDSKKVFDLVESLQQAENKVIGGENAKGDSNKGS